MTTHCFYFAASPDRAARLVEECGRRKIAVAASPEDATRVIVVSALAKPDIAAAADILQTLDGAIVAAEMPLKFPFNDALLARRKKYGIARFWQFRLCKPPMTPVAPWTSFPPQSRNPKTRKSRRTRRSLRHGARWTIFYNPRAAVIISAGCKKLSLHNCRRRQRGMSTRESSLPRFARVAFGSGRRWRRQLVAENSRRLSFYDGRPAHRLVFCLARKSASRRTKIALSARKSSGRFFGN